jgi:hypothetical protein
VVLVFIDTLYPIPYTLSDTRKLFVFMLPSILYLPRHSTYLSIIVTRENLMFVCASVSVSRYCRI